MSAQLVKELREKTGAGFIDCKKAIEESGGDLNKAVEYLRKKGLAAASKKAGRSANDGRIHSYIHSNFKVGVMVEINCETDFVARTDDFQGFANDVAMHIAATNPRYLDKDAVPAADVESERGIIRAQVEQSGKTGPVVDKIIEGKLGKFYEENCLLHQKFVKDPDKTIQALLTEKIAKLGENISIRRFVRYQLGESSAPATQTLN